MENHKLTKEQIENIEDLNTELQNTFKVPLDLFDDETETLYSRIDKESINYNSKCEHAIDKLTMAQAVMFEEFEGRDIDGIYSDFDDLIEKIERYHLGE